MKWKPLKSVDYLVVHCSDTQQEDIGVGTIRRDHRRRGWLDVGYHKIIRRDGTIDDGRPMNAPGAHARGFNHISLGICLVGGMTDGEPNYTEAQYATLHQLVADLKTMYPSAIVTGYCDMPKVNKRTPYFDVQAWWTEANV